MHSAFRTAALLAIAISTQAVKAQTVTLDYYFNHEFRTNKTTGQKERFHYTWEDKASSGYSIWGDLFVKNGGTLKSLETAPTAASLKGTDVYIIVDPDTKKETENPNYIQAADIKAIGDWVKAGGVLVMLANDSANVELEHFNHLAAVFGIHFNMDIRNLVPQDKFDMGGLTIAPGDPIFTTARKVYIKEVCTISVTPPAKAALTDKGDVIIATAKYGKGTVFAVGDPWFYNEYCNGRLPASFGFENDKAAGDLAKWLLQQVPKK
jgi:unsaturated rhamnogalacturonyl hydrolase